MSKTASSHLPDPDPATSKKSTPKKFAPKKLVQRSTSGLGVTLWCIAGLVVVGVGLSYAIHLGFNGDDRRSDASTPAQVRMMPGSSVAGMGSADLSEPLRTERSKMAMGTVTALTRPQPANGRAGAVAGSMTIRLVSNDTRTLIIDGDTKVNSDDGDNLTSVKVGEVVVIEASEVDGKLYARLIICGRITAGAPR